MPDTAQLPWRADGHVIYAWFTYTDDAGDECEYAFTIGYMNEPYLAEAVVDAHNAAVGAVR